MNKNKKLILILFTVLIIIGISFLVIWLQKESLMGYIVSSSGELIKYDVNKNTIVRKSQIPGLWEFPPVKDVAIAPVKEKLYIILGPRGYPLMEFDTKNLHRTDEEKFKFSADINKASYAPENIYISDDGNKLIINLVGNTSPAPGSVTIDTTTYETIAQSKDFFHPPTLKEEIATIPIRGKSYPLQAQEKKYLFVNESIRGAKKEITVNYKKNIKETYYETKYIGRIHMFDDKNGLEQIKTIDIQKNIPAGWKNDGNMFLSPRGEDIFYPVYKNDKECSILVLSITNEKIINSVNITGRLIKTVFNYEKPVIFLVISIASAVLIIALATFFFIRRRKKKATIT
ncbi:MAG TPA: hypothetical protein ENI23_16260 [bacterium]|nr:hypothetical protein [bacterium]